MSPKIVVGDQYPIKPSQIKTDHLFWSAYGGMETEASARVIIQLCQKLGHWGPFTPEQLSEFLQLEGHRSPFCFYELIDPDVYYEGNELRLAGGWQIIRSTRGQYYVTEDFIVRCYNADPTDQPTNSAAPSP